MVTPAPTAAAVSLPNVPRSGWLGRAAVEVHVDRAGEDVQAGRVDLLARGPEPPGLGQLGDPAVLDADVEPSDARLADDDAVD